MDVKGNIKAQMMELLEHFGYEPNAEAVDKIVEVAWAHNDKLRKIFQGHPCWDEWQQRICLTTKYVRGTDTHAIQCFFDWLAHTCIPARPAVIPEKVDELRKKDGCLYLPQELYDALAGFRIYAGQYITKEFAEVCERCAPDAHIKEGSKTSKAINKLLRYLGYSNHPDYNREFAKFADGINPLITGTPIFISINPLDYLTMSFGNSWASCHTIDKDNTRDCANSYEGMYASGTMSYMLDDTSFVVYTTSPEGTYYFRPENYEKITRQMFHYADGALLQGRLYPDDENEDIASKNREIVQDVIAKCTGHPNFWKGTSKWDIVSHGTHYRDYSHFSENCHGSFLKDYGKFNRIVIGNDPICIHCGYPHSSSGQLSCCKEFGKHVCACCGCSADYMFEIDGEVYCENCVEPCACCEEYFLRDDLTYINGEYVCPECLHSEFYVCSDCGEYVHRHSCHIVDGETVVCDDCFDDYIQCDGCGEYIHYASLTKIDDCYYCASCVESMGREVA